LYHSCLIKIKKLSQTRLNLVQFKLSLFQLYLAKAPICLFIVIRPINGTAMIKKFIAVGFSQRDAEYELDKALAKSQN